jgi:Protein of unknown function (DUF1569)
VDAYLEQASAAVEAAVGGLTVEQVGRTIPGKWSVAEILEHLTLGLTINAQALERAVISGDPRAHPPRLAQRLARLVVVDLGYFPPAVAPGNVTPRGTLTPENCRQEVAAALVSADAALTRAADCFGERTPLLKHPFFAGLTVPQWRKFHWRHVVHHMRQVRARTSSGLPFNP